MEEILGLMNQLQFFLSNAIFQNLVLNASVKAKNLSLVYKQLAYINKTKQNTINCYALGLFCKKEGSQ